MRSSIIAIAATSLLCAASAQAAPNFAGSGKSVDKTVAQPGDTLTFTIKVINTGDAANITVQDTLPAGVTYVPGSTTAAAPGFPINIDVPDNGNQSALAAGFTIPVALPTTIPFLGTLNEVDFTLRATVNANATGAQCNTANISGGGAFDAVTTNPCATVPAPQLATPELTVKINGNASSTVPHTASPGDSLQYNLLISNTGTVAATGVHLHVDAPPDTTGFLVIAQGDQNATLTQSTSGGANGTGEFDLTNMTVPANFALAVIWQATVFTPAQFAAAGISAAQINGRQLPEQGTQSVSTTTTLSDDPATAAANDPTIVTMKFGTQPDFSGFIKSLAGSESRQPGDTLVYTLTIPNDGTAPATSVKFTDTLDPRLIFVSATANNGGSVAQNGNALTATWPQPLAAGSSDSVVLTMKLPAALANGTQISNQAFASSAEIMAPVPSDDPATPAPGDPTIVTIQSAPDLSGITKTVAASPSNPPHTVPGIHPGDTVVYTLTIPNDGTADATQVVVTDPIDPRLTPVQPIANGGVFANGTITWSPAAPITANGAPLVLTFSAVVAKPLANGTVIANQATVSAQGVGAQLSDDPSTPAPHDTTKFTVVSAPDLSTSTKAVKNQTHTDGTFHGGDQLQFTIQPINTGDAPTSATVITDVLDANLTFVSAGQGGTYTAGTRTVQWNLPGGVSTGTVAPVTFIATIARPIADGTTISNFATITAPELPAAGVNTNTVTITVHSAPDLSGITKAVAMSNGAPIVAAVAPGTILLYTIKVPNAGDANATNVVVTDPIDPNLDQVTPQNGGALNGTTITWSLGGITTGASTTVTFTARVKLLTANGTVISNQASATSSEITVPQLSDDPSTAAAHDPTLVTVNSKPDLSTSTKTVAVQNQVAPGVLRPGDSLLYTISVINTGNTFADNVVVTDPLPTDLNNALPNQGGSFANNAVTWNSSTTPALAHVAPGAAGAVTLSFTATVIASAHDGDVISNQGQLSCDEASGFVTDDPSTTAAHDPTKITVHFPVLTLTKAVRADFPRADGTIHPGDFVDYTITLTNSGSLAATNVTIDDPIDPNLDTVTAGSNGTVTAAQGNTQGHVDWNSTTTPALASVTSAANVVLTIRARVKPGTVNGTVVSDQATLHATELLQSLLSDDPSTAAANDPTRFTVKAIANLSTTTKTVTNTTRSDGTYRPGDSISYAIAVKNSGDASASHVVVQDPLDPALTQVAAPNGTIANNQIVWSATTVPALNSVAPGAEVDLSFTAVISANATDGEIVSNQASLSFDELAGGAPQLSDDPTTPAANDPTRFSVTAGPHLSHSIKTVTDTSNSSGVIRPGDTLEYEIHVLNDGSQAATNTTLIDPPPPETTYVAGSTTLNGVAIPDVSGASALVAGLRVHSARTGTADGTVLASSGAVPDDTVAAVSFKVRVVDGAVAGTQISNQGLLRADKVPQAVTDDPSTPSLGDPTVVVVGSASLLTAEKSWSLATDQNGNGAADVGDVIQYSIEVDNRGTQPAAGVAVDDDLPAGATYVAGSLALNGTSLTDAADGDPGSVVGTHVHVAAGALAASAHAIVTFRMLCNTAGVLSNQAQITTSSGISINSDGDPTLPGIQSTLTPVGASTRADLSGSAKSVLDENGGDVEPGDALTYTITLVNSGGIDTTTALVDDTLPPGLTYIANSATGDGTITFTPIAGAAGVINASNITVKAGGRAQIQFRVRVLANVGIGSTIRNEAGVRSVPGDTRLPLPVVVVVGQAQGSSSIAGAVAWDLNGDGVVSNTDRPLPGFQILVRRADLNNGSPVKTLITDAQGNYRATDLPPAPYFLEALSPEGTHFADGSAALSGQGGTVAALDFPIAPMGALVHSDRSAISGARAVLLYDDTEVGNTPPACETDRTPISIAPQMLAEGKTLPRAVSPGCLRAGQQDQTTGSLGIYRFDITGAASTGPRKYRLYVLPETPLLTFPGSKPAPTAGFASAGPVVPNGDPTASAGARWFQHFTLAPGDLVTNNHVELDSSAMRLVKISTRATAMIGDIVGYVVTLQNPSSQDILIGANNTGGVHINDVLPTSLRYAAGSARADRLVPNGSGATNATGVQPAADRHCPLLSQDAQGVNCPGAKQGPALPERGKLGQATVGANLDFGPYDLKAGESLEVRYQAMVLTSAVPGDAINSAVARSGGANISNSDSAIVRIAQDPLFDLTSLIGKVYCESDTDRNADHKQDKGELGVPGVRIYEDEGWFAETDQDGKFHFRGLQPGLHRFKIDVRTLPVGDEPFDDGSFTSNLTAGLDARANFPISCHRVLVGPDRVTLKVAPPPPVLPRAMEIDSSTLETRLNGVPLLLSRGALRQLSPNDSDFRRSAREDVVESSAELKPLRFETLLASGPVPVEWRATLLDAAGTLLGESSGAGAPPDAIEIKPNQALPIGATIRAQLELKSAAGKYLSPLLALRVVAVQPPAEVVDSFLLHGTLFEEQNATPTRELGRQLAKAIDEAKAKPELLIDLEVHTAGAGSPDAERALSEQRARAVRDALLSAGLAPERIRARGRGSDVPLAINVTEKARLENRRVAIQLLKPPPPAPAPDAIAVEALAQLEGKPLAVTSGPQAIGEVPVGETRAIVLQRNDGARAEFAIPKEPLAMPPSPIAVHLEVAARTLSIDGISLEVPLLGLSVDPLVDDTSSRRIVLDAGGVPRALSFSLRAPVDGVVSWRLLVGSLDGAEAAELTGEGAPPRRIAWPVGKPLPSGLLSARLSVKTRDGGEGRSPLAEFQAAPPAEPVLRETHQAGELFPGRDHRLSRDGIKKTKLLADKLLAAAGAGGRVEVDIFSDDEADAQKITDARATSLTDELAKDGVSAAQLTVRARGSVLPIAPNATAPGRRANNRVVLSALAADKPLPEIEPMPASVRVGDARLAVDGTRFSGSLTALPASLPIDLSLSSGAGATAKLELPFAAAAAAPNTVRSITGAPIVLPGRGASAEAMVASSTNSTVSVGRANAPPPPPPPGAPPLILADDSSLPLPPAIAPAPAVDTSAKPAVAPAMVDASTAPPAIDSARPMVPVSALPVPIAALPNAAAAQPPPSATTMPAPVSPAVSPTSTSLRHRGHEHDADPASASTPASPPMISSTVAVSSLPAGALPLAAHLTADLPAEGSLLRAEALWVRGSTDPHNKLTLNNVAVKVDAKGNFAARVALRRGDQLVNLTSTDVNGETATIERKVHVDPDGLFLLLVGEGDIGQSGAQLDGVGSRADFSGVFLKGRAAGVLEGRWDTSQKTNGFFKDLQLSGNFDTSRGDDPDAFVELYDPSQYYPVDGDSGLFGQQAASRGPVYLNFKADDSHLIIGNFKTQSSEPTEQLFRFDRTLYGIDLDVQKAIAVAGPGKPGLDTKVDLFVADGDLRQHHAHGELRGTGGSIYYLKDSDIVDGSEQVRLVVRDANTGLELLSIDQTRDVDYTIQVTEGRIVFKQAVPSVADTSFLATANYTTSLTGHPIYVVIDYDYRGAIGEGGHAGGAHIQETLFGIVTAGGGVASEDYSGGSAYTLGGINLGIKPKPHTFLNIEAATSSGTDSESYTSVDGGLTFGSLAPSCVNSSSDVYACNSSGRAFRIEAGFELADWLDRKPPEKVATPNIGTATVGTATASPGLPTPSGMPGAPAVGPGDLLRANAYFDTRDDGFYNSGGDMDQGATKAGFLLRWTPDLRTQLTGRVDQVASDVALSFDDTTGYTTKRVLRRFSGLQATRTLGDPDTFAGRFTLTAELDDTYTDDSQLGTTFADQALFGAIFRATPKLNFSLYQEGVWNADASQYPTFGDRMSTTLGATYKLNEKLYANLEETVIWSGNNSTVFGLRTPLFSTQSSVYANEQFNLVAGSLQSTTVLGAEEKMASGTRMYGEYQIDDQASAAQQRAVLGLANKWEVRPGLFASVGFERAQVLGGVGADLGGGFTGDGSNIPGAAPGATLGGIAGQSPIAGTSLNPTANCTGTTTGTTSSMGGSSLGVAPVAGGSSTCTNGLGYNPAGAYYPGTTNRNSSTVSLEYLGSDKFKLSAKGELRLDQADQRLVGVIPGVADRLHFLVSVDLTSKLNQDFGAFGRVHIAQTEAQNVADPNGPQIAEARWVEMTAGLTYRPVETDWLAVQFKATHLIDLRPLDLVSGIADEQTSDVFAISPTFELPWHIAIAEKLAYKHTRDVLEDGPALDTSTWLWVNRLDLHLHKLVDFSGEFRILALRGPSSGAVGVGGDGQSGVLLEVAFKPSKFARIGVGWNFTSFSDDELARYDGSAGGFFIRAVGEY